MSQKHFQILLNFNNDLYQCFSKCGPQTSTISISWEVIKNANSQPPTPYCPRSTESETLWMGPISNVCVLTSPPVNFDTCYHLNSPLYVYFLSFFISNNFLDILQSLMLTFNSFFTVHVGFQTLISTAQAYIPIFLTVPGMVLLWVLHKVWEI